MISVEGVHMKFGDSEVLHDVAFKVARGSVVALVGANGAGKTTLLRILATLLSPTAGRVEVGGYDVARQPARVRSIIGFIPDVLGLFENMTVRECLEFFAAAHGVPESHRPGRIDAVSDLAEIADLYDRLVDDLSRGQKQRVSVARALLHDPEVLLLDEPASGLDPRARAGMRGLLRRLAEHGKTIAVSSHLLDDLEEVCSDVAILHEGRLALFGTCAKVFATLRDTRLLIISFDGSVARDAEPVRAPAWATHLEWRAGTLRATLAPGATASAVVRSLVLAGMPVSEVHHPRPRLEDAFLHATE